MSAVDYSRLFEVPSVTTAPSPITKLSATDFCFLG
jgi:hypothetical protein